MLDIYKHINNSLQALEGALRIAIANADNFNTPGFKYTFTSFTTMFNDVRHEGLEKTNPIQYGPSMTIGATATDYSQGNIGFGTGLDSAIVGEGFFMLSQSSNEFDSGAPKVYTRAGQFARGFDGKHLVDNHDRKVFAFKLTKTGQIANPIPEAINVEDELDIGFLDGGILVNNYQAKKDAIAKGDTGDDLPEQEFLYQLALTTFRNKQGLVLGSGSALKSTSASGQPIDPSISDDGVYGEVRAEALESSNISVAKVALDMNQLNRGFSAVQGIIDDINRIVNQLVQKLSA